MTDRFITLAIHKIEKASILRQLLGDNDIAAVLEPLGDSTNTQNINGYVVKVRQKDLYRAFQLIEEHNLFNYSDKLTHKIDDGRKRILVAVDFSKQSLQACHTAFDIASKVDAKVKILNVFHNLYFPTTIPFSDSLKEPGEPSILDRSRKQMLDLCHEIDADIASGDLSSVNYSYSLREGSVADEINDFVTEYQPILLIMGTKGAGDNRADPLGNIAASVIEITNVPVLAISQDDTIKTLSDINHIVFLTNLNKRDFLSFDFLASILNQYTQAKITLLHIDGTDQNSQQRKEAEMAEMKKLLSLKYPKFEIAATMLEPDENMYEKINNFLTQEKVNVVCLNTRRRNLFGRMFAPSMSRKVIANSQVSILVLRGNQ
ncbi:MAG: putative universal stress protein UspA [Bacteroidetes bacterium]|nr:putative universal stress protein UspA [Bacteroidota bacterium]